MKIHRLTVLERAMEPGARARRLAGAMLFACLALAGANASAAPSSYEIDTEHLTIAFMVEHIGYAKTLGLFNGASGSFDYDDETGTLSNVRVEVDTSSVNTHHEKRDGHVRSKDFLNVKKHPTMTFTAASGESLGGDRYRIDGELTLLGVTQPLTLEATRNKADNYPFGGKPFVIGVSARGGLKRSAFGMQYAVENGLVGDEVELILEFEARRK